VSALVRLLYPLPPTSRAPAAIIAWWERRRLRFNLIVGAAGVVSITVANLIFLVPPASRLLGPPPLLAIVAYGALANLCYTAGWASELAFNAWWRDDPPPVGPVLFRQGLIFSVGLTLLPIAFAAITWGARLLGSLF
jgi:hypothetical protein